MQLKAGDSNERILRKKGKTRISTFRAESEFTFTVRYRMPLLDHSVVTPEQRNYTIKLFIFEILPRIVCHVKHRKRFSSDNLGKHLHLITSHLELLLHPRCNRYFIKYFFLKKNMLCWNLKNSFFFFKSCVLFSVLLKSSLEFLSPKELCFSERSKWGKVALQ